MSFPDIHSDGVFGDVKEKVIVYSPPRSKNYFA